MQRTRAGRHVLVSGLALMATLSSPHAWAADDPPARVIEYRDDKLTVRLTGVPMSEVLAELGRQSGAEVRGGILESRDVTTEFDSVPLPDALSRLLGEQNFALVYGRGGRLKAVRLFGGTDLVQSATAPPSETASPADTRPPFPGSLPALIDRHPPVPISGPLAEALGTQSATLAQLIDLSLHHEDGALRAEALRTSVATLEGDPELRNAVTSELEHADSALLSSLLRASASDQAEDIAAQMLREFQTPRIRIKASAILQRLRSS